MSTPQLVSTGIGLRNVRVAERDDDGAIKVPAATAVGTAYRGLKVSGAVALTVAIPDPQRVPARGDDRTYYTFQLPPTESPTGELRVTKSDFDVIALLTGTLRFGSPPIRKVGLGTDKQGEEPAVVLWGSRQAIDSEEGSAAFGTQIWQTYVFLNAVCAVKPATMEDAAIGEITYSVVGNDATVDEFGSALTIAEHGFTKAPFIMVTSRYKYMLEAFLGDGAQTQFTLSETPHASGTMLVAVEGVIQAAAAYGVTDKVITLAVPPGVSEKVIVEYEYA